jgi:glycosyltransferase involved in cell wall biosynthesis
VVTVHGPLEGDFLEYYRALSETVGLVSLFEVQRTRAPDLGWLATVSNGGDVESFPFREDKDEYLVWLGRFCEDKAPHLAIDAARAVGLPIVLAGKCVEPDEKAYFAQRIRPAWVRA